MKRKVLTIILVLSAMFVFAEGKDSTVVVPETQAEQVKKPAQSATAAPTQQPEISELIRLGDYWIQYMKLLQDSIPIYENNKFKTDKDGKVIMPKVIGYKRSDRDINPTEFMQLMINAEVQRLKLNSSQK